MTLRETRLALGLSIKDLTKKLAIHQETWGKWERGEQKHPAIAKTAISMTVYLSKHGLLEDWQKFNAQNPGIAE